MPTSEKPITKRFIEKYSDIEGNDYENVLYNILMSSNISEKNLIEMGIAKTGFSYHCHFLLVENGERTNWLVKRLRLSATQNMDILFDRYKNQHDLFEKYFGGFIPETTFFILPKNFDNNYDEFVKGKEYVLFQEFIDGASLKEASEKYAKKTPVWLGKEIAKYSECYKKMQKETRIIPECFDIELDQCIVDSERKKLYLIDTNNPITIWKGLKNNWIFKEYFDGNINDVTPCQVNDIFMQVCKDYNFNPKNHNMFSGDLKTIWALIDIQHTAELFPKDFENNKYLASLIEAFGLSNC